MSWPEFLEDWLALTSVNYHRNVWVSILLNKCLALTMLRATGPWLLNWVLSQSLVSNELTRVKFRALGLRQSSSLSICRVSHAHVISYPDLTLFYTGDLGTRLTPTDTRPQLTCLAQCVPPMQRARRGEFSFNVRYVDGMTFLCETLKCFGRSFIR